MKRAQKDPELFTIVPGAAGRPWEINGEPTEADTPRDAIAQVHALAARFPAHLRVYQGDQVIALEVDRKGRTQPIPDTQDRTERVEEQEATQEEPAAPPVVAPAAPAVAVAPVTPSVAPTVSAEPVGQQLWWNREKPAPVGNTDRPRLLITPMRLAGVVALVTILGIGGVIASQISDDEQTPDAAAQEPEISLPAPALKSWTVPEGQDVLSIIGDRIITAEGATVRLFDAKTGEETWSMADVDDAAEVRSIDGTTASAVDIGAGQVVVLRDGEVSVVSGVLNARGTEPVITDDRDYTGPDGTKESLENSQVVLAAIAEGVVRLESPDKIVIEGTTVELVAPEDDATITQAIRATDERVVMVWSREDVRWLTTHELESGAVQLQQDIGAAEVTVRSRIVWIGSDQILIGDEIRPVCDGGEQVTATIICPGPDGWESADGTQQYAERPDAISSRYTVTAGTVTTRRTGR